MVRVRVKVRVMVKVRGRAQVRVRARARARVSSPYVSPYLPISPHISRTSAMWSEFWRAISAPGQGVARVRSGCGEGVFGV